MRASSTSEQRTNYDTCASQAGRGRSISKNALAAAPPKSDQLSGATIQYFSNRWLLTRRTNRVVHHSKIWLLMSEMGHKRKSSLRAFDVRFPTHNDRTADAVLCRLRAKSGHAPSPHRRIAVPWFVAAYPDVPKSFVGSHDAFGGQTLWNSLACFASAAGIRSQSGSHALGHAVQFREMTP